VDIQKIKDGRQKRVNLKYEGINGSNGDINLKLANVGKASYDNYNSYIILTINIYFALTVLNFPRRLSFLRVPIKDRIKKTEAKNA